MFYRYQTTKTHPSTRRKPSRPNAIIAFLFLSFCFVSPIQATNALQFNHITTEQGLTHNSVTALHLDSRGFMWIGTAYGLCRYDGYEFKTFRPIQGDSLSLPNYWVRNIAEDKQGRLFIGTAYGLALYDRQTERFHRIALSNITTSHILQLQIDDHNQLWISTGGATFKVKSDNHNAITNQHRVFPSLNKISQTFLPMPDGSVWIGTKQGLVYWHAPSDSLIWHQPPPHPQNTPSIITLHRDTHNNIWAGSESGMFRVNTHNRTLEPDTKIPADYAITAIFDDKQGHLWVGTRNRGILVVNQQTGKVSKHIHNPEKQHSLGKGTVVTILKDHSNMIWLGTYGGGINLVVPRNQEMKAITTTLNDPTSLSSNNVFSVLKDKKGMLWVGTANGINRITQNGLVNKVYKQMPNASSGISHNVVRALYEDQQGRFWIGTDAGLNLLDRKTETITTFQHEANNPHTLSNNVIRRIHEDKNGIFWIGTNNGGLNRFTPKTHQFTRMNEAFPHLQLGSRCIRTIFEDASGTLWLGTSHGLARYHPNTQESKAFFYNPKDPTSLSSSSVYALASAKDGGLWIGTAAGLNHFNPITEKFTHYTVQDGLSSNIIYNIFLDAMGDLWVSTDRGISRIQVSTAPSRQRLSVRSYNQSDGVVGTEFNTGASYQAPNGTLYFGGMAGLNIFHPDSLRHENTYRPPIVFTTCEVYTGRDISNNPYKSLPGISEKTTLRLPHTSTHISLSFALLDFTAPEKNLYAYWLEGLDPDWVQLKHQRHLNLNLSPGTYQLHIKGANHNGQWTPKIRTLGIVVETPYWMTNWFRISAIAFVIALISIGYKIRLKSIKTQNDALDQLVKELEAKNTELERFTYTVSHDLKSPLVTIEGFLGMIEKDVETKQYDRITGDAAFIRNAVSNMHELLNDLLDLSRVGRMTNELQSVHLGELAKEALHLTQGRFQTGNIAISIAGDFPTIMGDKRRLLEVFQNLLDNAAKFTAGCPKPHVEVGVRQNGTEPILFVKDNGIGIDSQYHTKVFGLFERLDTHTEGTGIGLALVKRIIEFHNGRIWIESDGKNKGSTLCFTLPGIRPDDIK